MAIKVLNIKIWIIFFFHWIHFYSSQEKTDTLTNWMASYANYHGLISSGNDRWVLVHKKYNNNSDTILIVDTKASLLSKKYLVGLNVKQRFIGSTALLAQGTESLEYIRLSDLRSFSYGNVRKMDVLAEKKKFIILDNDNTLKIYDENATLVNEIENVRDYVTDESKVLIAIVNTGQQYSLVDTMLKNPVSLYTTNNPIVRTPKFSIDKFASFTETESIGKRIMNVLIDLQISSVQIPLRDKFIDAEFLQVTKMGKNDVFIIDFEKKLQSEINPVVDILYGNDQYLRGKKKGVRKSECWTWDASKGIAKELPSDEFSDFISMNSERYLLAFSNAEKFGYRYSSQVFPLFLYDRNQNSSIKICGATRDVVISSNARYIAMLNEFDQKWELYDVQFGKKFDLGNEKQKPSFSSDGKYILFESNNGLQVYSLDKKIFLDPFLFGRKISILRKNHRTVYEKYSSSFAISDEELSEGLLLKAVNTDRNTTAYFKFNGKELRNIFERNCNYIREIIFSTNSRSHLKAITIEEFYNKVPELFVYTDNHKITVTATKKEDRLKRDVINFKNAIGEDLKGVLFYPINFDPNRKYPMVVRLYQEQNSISNRYLYPVYEGDGFNIRILMERGFFVYLPDTKVDNRGSGISALDCVNSALDALLKYDFIDRQKIGLIGQSFGGYETNYIATQSKRFATYISGAGMSNMISRYFSYNPNYGINEYSRIETGQFKMNEPFSSAKIKYLNNDPIYNAEQVDKPILLWSGSDDVNVPVSQTTSFYTALQKNHKNVVALIYNNQDHVLTKDSEAIKDLNRRILEWWDYFLKERQNTDWISKQIKKEAD